MRRDGLTLVEMLVVMGVMAVLGALLGAALLSGTRTARGVECSSRLKQILTGWTECVNESKIAGPTGGFAMPRVQEAGGETWVDTLGRYLDDADVFDCPLQASADGHGYGMNPTCGAAWSYPEGWFRGGFLLTPEDNRPANLSLVLEPSRTLLLADGGSVAAGTEAQPAEQWQEDVAAAWKPYLAFDLRDTTSALAGMFSFELGYDWGNVYSMSGVGSMGWDPKARALPRHEGQATAGFLDLHVKAHAMRDLVEPQWGAPDCLIDNQPPQ